MSILVTGGAGYIGSHTVIDLVENGMDPVIADNLCNSKFEAVKRVRELCGREVKFYEYDLCDIDKVRDIFEKEPIDAVIHFAGLKAVGESVAKPLEYFRNNLGNTLNILQVMREHGVKNFVFSSSATVYGQPKSVPIKEDFPLSVTNPYGRTKLMIEDILRDVYAADPSMNIALLRYFNPIGAHKSGLIGENPRGIPNNLLPYVAKVAAGQLPFLQVYGNDYDTPDGTGVRDYIHVVDLAKAHLKALQRADQVTGVEYYNIGTGVGYSVLDIVHAYEKASGLKVPYKIVARRPGDIATCYADPTKAAEILGWRAEFGIEDMCRDMANWQKKNPNGYEN